MEKAYQSQGQDLTMSASKTLEINPDHPVIYEVAAGDSLRGGPRNLPDETWTLELFGGHLCGQRGGKRSDPDPQSTQLRKATDSVLLKRLILKITW